jgi:protein TonB
MYRSDLNPRDRTATLAIVLAIHAGLGFALLNLSGNLRSVDPQRDLQIFDISVPPPPPPVVEKLPEPEKAKPKKAEGAASAKNIKSKATPVVAPKPRVVVPAPTPVVAAPVPNTGADKTQGASDVVGPGTGAGGVGTGTGSGGSGSGSGGGGDGGGSRPQLISRTLTQRDYPRALTRIWPSRTPVLVAVRVQLDGRGTDCKINRSSGVREIDIETCRLVETKLRFRPAVNGRGERYVAWYGYIQQPVNF